MFVSLATGVMVKFILNVNLLIVFYKMKFPPYYGVITASIFGYVTSFIVCLIILNKKYEINFEECVNNFIEVLCGSILMALVLFILRFIVPITVANRLLNLVIIILYTLIGIIVYFIYVNKVGVMKRIFGNSITTLLKRIKK